MPDHAAPATPKSSGAAGRTYIECTAQAVPAHLLCDIAVTGGTGDYSGASGEVALTDISAEDPGDETVTLYEANLE